MFLAIVFIVLGLLLLLNALGIVIAGNFWGFFWAILFLAIGIKLLAKRGKCPFCGWGMFSGKMHQKFHKGMEEDCCCQDGGHCCDEHEKQ